MNANILQKLNYSKYLQMVAEKLQSSLGYGDPFPYCCQVILHVSVLSPSLVLLFVGFRTSRLASQPLPDLFQPCRPTGRKTLMPATLPIFSKETTPAKLPHSEALKVKTKISLTTVTHLVTESAKRKFPAQAYAF